MKRREFQEKLAELIPQFGKENIIYFDESGFKAHCYRDSGWAVRGQKIYGDVTGKRERNTNLIMAQRGKGKSMEWLAPMVFKGSCTAKLVETWIEKMLLKELSEPTIVIMDNAAFHNRNRLQAILAKGYHYLLALPPYSPDLNPIEQTFGAMKKRRQSLPENTNIEDLIMSYY